MTPTRKPVHIINYTGAINDTPAEKWLHLYKMKTATANWTEGDQLRNFNVYLEGEAFRWFPTEIFETMESWDDLKERMMERVSASVAEPFRAFIHCRQKRGQAVKEYYNS